jgi:putative ABC transport system substrate-binding protein
VNTLNVEIMAKRLEVLHELVPAAKIIAALINPTNLSVIGETETRDLQTGAHTLGLTLHVLYASSDCILPHLLTFAAGH